MITGNDLQGIQKVYKNYLDQLSDLVKEKPEGYVLEFGVYKGCSINHIAHYTKDTVYGFDAFEGLPEKWMEGHPKGHFKCEPPITHDNVQLVIGWFEDTVFEWTNENKGRVGFLHIDCDLYSSCRTVLRGLDHRIEKGTIIVFDELGNFNGRYPDYEFHELKALNEWIDEFDRDVELISRDNTHRVAIRVL